jgi:D-alanyl-D-alanine dipeptidase
MTTSHVSAGRRRRQRARRTATVAVTLLLLAGGTAGYAAWHGDDPAAGGASAQSRPRPVVAAPSDAAAPRSTSKAARPHASSMPKGSSAARSFAPVVTDRIPEPTTSIAFSAPVPGLTNMQRPAARAFERAFAAARAAGLVPQVRSAWRSREYQQVLFDRAVTTYGSRAEAGRWVLTPLRSAHVKGYAVDVHPAAVASWLAQHGSAYGLCRTYDNEWWHFEYVASSTCPARKPDAAG